MGFNCILCIVFLFTTSFAYSQAPDTAAYAEIPVTVAAENNTLHGTLTLPGKTLHQVPVVLIIPGSGFTDRDGNNLSAGLHSDSYKQLADSLASHNIASLRYDKRVVDEIKNGQPSSKLRLFDTEVDDAKRLVEYLKKDKKFSEVIVIGHSQGSLIGILSAEGASKFISVAGLGYKGNETLKKQLSDQPAFVSEQANPIIDSLAAGFTVRNIPDFLEPLFKAPMQPYLISWFKYDPAVELSKLKIPSLVIQGDNDVQIGVADAQRLVSLSAKARLVIIEKMNHVFKLIRGSKEDNLASYSKPDLPVSPILINVITEFITH